MLRASGYKDVDVALVNSVRCRPRANATPSMQQVRACRPFLLRAIEVLRPEIIVGLGGTALRALTNNGANNVTEARGKQLIVPGLPGNGTVRPVESAEPTQPAVQPGEEGSGTPEGPAYSPSVFVTYHPAAILHGATALEQRIVDDLRRVFFEELPHPETAVPTGSTLGVDTEWSKAGTFLTLGLADDTHAIAVEENFDSLAEALWKAETVVGHSVAQEVEKLVEQGLPVKEEWCNGTRTVDSLLVARMADENNLKGGYELENLLRSFSKVEGWKYETEVAFRGVPLDRRDFGDLPSDVRTRRCRLDSWAGLRIAKHFAGMLRDKLPLVRFTHRIASTLSRLSLTGAIVDLPALEAEGARLETELTRTRDLLTKQALAAGLPEFSPTNDGHIRTLLFDKLGLPVLERTAKDKLPAVDKVTLGQLDHPTVRLLLDHNAADKLFSVNVVGVRELITELGVLEELAGRNRVGFLPFHFNPLGAKTGRRSTYDPNSQNWPKSIRAILRSRWPGGLIGDFDYSKLEMVLLAWAAKDDALMHDFTVGGGYIAAAKRILGTDVEDGTDLYRGIKSIILGVDYNMQTPKMSWQLWIRNIRFSADYDAHVAEVDRLRRKYLATYPGIMRYMEAREAELVRNGSVCSATGRVRHLPCPDGPRAKGFGRLLNQAINFPIQSLASDVTGSALIDLEAELLALHGLTYAQYLEALLRWNKKCLTKDANYGIIPVFEVGMSLIINEVHDDIVVDLHPDHVKRDTELVIETMRSVKTLRRLVPSFDAPLNVGTKVGARWGVKG